MITAKTPRFTRAQLDAIRECMRRHQGLSACSVVWALVPELRDFADGMTSGSGLGSYPLDPDDFSRCRRVLALIPNGIERVAGGEMAVAFPKVGAWARLGACWPELEALWIEEENNPDHRMPKLYARMQKARGPKA